MKILVNLFLLHSRQGVFSRFKCAEKFFKSAGSSKSIKSLLASSEQFTTFLPWASLLYGGTIMPAFTILLMQQAKAICFLSPSFSFSRTKVFSANNKPGSLSCLQIHGAKKGRKIVNAIHSLDFGCMKCFGRYLEHHNSFSIGCASKCAS